MPLLLLALVAAPPPAAVTGELKVWHPVTLTLTGPKADERGIPNPFTDLRLDVTFRHESGTPEYRVPGYFAADGDAANSSADAGTAWRAHLTPDKAGKWTWSASFVRGHGVAHDPKAESEKVAPVDGQTGTFAVAASDKTGRDLRAKGRLDYVGKHYPRFAGTGDYFLKAGPDGPETLLAYTDFDGTEAKKPGFPARDWKSHQRDWRAGDPTWQGGKGKGLIGAFNYLADKGCNAVSFLTYNADGDGDNVWPFAGKREKLRYDCSKLDQWRVVFEHAQARGVVLLFELSEQENDDNRVGRERKPGTVPAALDGGALGPERKVYHRELVARFAHLNGLVWDLGEENTHTPDEMRAVAAHLRSLDPYRHPIIVHTFPQEQDAVYGALLAKPPALEGAALQNHWSVAHRRAAKWVEASRAAGRPWLVGGDEQNLPDYGVPPDPGYAGFPGSVSEPKLTPERQKELGFVQSDKPYDLHDIRKRVLWGTLTAGGYGVEYYFGNRLPQSDKVCDDFRSRDKSWGYCRHALDFFHREKVPFWEMASADALVGNPDHDDTRYCFAKPGEVYVVYLPAGGEAALDLGTHAGEFRVAWYDPRAGGELKAGSAATARGPGKVALGKPPADPEQDWVVLVRRAPPK